jgi:SHS2 domain-containing protein
VTYRVLDHTADVLVEVSAPDLAGLFAEAARSLFHILTDLEAVRPRDCLSVSVEAEDTEQLLVSWLSELLFLHETEQWLFSRFEMTAMEEQRVEAQVWGERLDPRRHPIDREVKAVTYHRLGLVREGDMLKTAVVFDL